MLDNLLLNVSSLHRLPPRWKNLYDSFRISCSVYHGTRRLCYDVWTKAAVIATEFYEKISFDEWFVCVYYFVMSLSISIVV